MATLEQTKCYIGDCELAKLARNFIVYIVCLVKLYVIGAISLLCQLIERSTPVKGLPSLVGKTAVVTGGASGIGFHVSNQLARLGARVVIATRSWQEAEGAIAVIKRECPSAEVVFMELDLASFKSVKKFATEFQQKSWPLDILINNAGVMLVPYALTEDGYEYHLQVNFLSHALLTSLLRDKMASSAKDGTMSRVVNVSSVVHHVVSWGSNIFTEKHKNGWSYSPHNAYSVSKLAILLYTYALSRRWAQDSVNVTVNAVHPGVVNTALYQHVHWPIAWAMDILRHFLFMNPEQAAISVVYVAVSPELEGTSGHYFSNCRKTGSSPTSKLPSLQEDVFALTNDIIQKKTE